MGAERESGTNAVAVGPVDESDHGRSDLEAPIRRSGALTVGAANDPAEHEADQVARSVVALLRDRPGPGLPDDGGDNGDTGRIRRSSTQRITRAATSPSGHGRIRRRAVGFEGGPVDAATESKIRASRGGGRPLDPDTRSHMGSAFGADFSKVRIHTGRQSAELNNRIQAKAFTLGSDVYFRDGAPDTSSSSGQELLAHELTHTIQQGGAVRRTTIGGESGRPIGRISRSVRRTVQRAEAITLIDTDVFKPDANDPTVVDDTSTGSSSITIKPGDPLDVDFAVTLNGKSGGAPHVLVRKIRSNDLEARGFKRYVKKSAMQAKGHQGAPDGETGGDKVGKTADRIGQFAGIVPEINDAQDGFIKSGGTVSADMESGMGVAAGAGDTVAMFTGLASAIVAFRAKDASGSDKAGAVLSGMSAVGGGAKGISGIIDKAGGGDTATATAQSIAGFADAFAGIKDTFFAIKHIVELCNQANTMSDKEKFGASMEIISELLSAIKSGVSSAKAFMDLWSGGAGAPLVNAVPGMGIALSAVDIIIRAVDLVSAMVTRSDMQTRKRKVKTGAVLGGTQGTSLKKEAKLFMDRIDSRRIAGAAVTEEDEEKYSQYEEYLLAKGLQYISSKRANRAILKISVAMGKIAGDVATLGGASAPVGIGIKAGAMALDVGASGFRRFKQWGRDKAATRKDAGKTGGFFGMFNADKSTAAKLAGYNRMVDKVFDMVIKVANIRPLFSEEQEAAAKQVGAFVGAMGLSVKRMYSMQGDPVALREEMIKAMKKRE